MNANSFSHPEVPHHPVRAGSSFVPRRAPVAPSLRLRATAANRSLLRWLRNAELADWGETRASSAQPRGVFKPLIGFIKPNSTRLQTTNIR